MTKQDLIKHISDNTGDSRSVVENVLNELAEAAFDELKNGGEFTLPGVGKLKAKERPARTGRNPQTGAAVEIDAKTVVKFSATKALTDHLN